jgi:hypothetical protein
MWGLVLGATLLLTAGKFDLDGTIASETRAGETPLIPDQASKPAAVTILTPDVGAQYLASTLRLNFDYSLRIFLREDADENHFHPIYLHTWTLAGRSRPTRLAEVEGLAQVALGATDYAYLPGLYGNNQAALANVPDIFSATARVRGQQAVSPAVRLELGLGATYQEQIDLPAQTPTPPMPVNPMMPGVLTFDALPTYSTVAVKPGASVILSDADQLTLASEVQAIHVSGLDSDLTIDPTGGPKHTLTSVDVQPTVTWRSHLTETSSLALSAGVTYGRIYSSYPVQKTSVTPVGGAMYDHRLISQRQVVARTTLGVAMDYYFDPILGEVTPHASATASVMLAFPREWSLGLEGNFVTTLSAHPVGNLYPDEVAAALSIPVRHRVSDYFFFEFGGRWSDRSPFFDTPAYGFHQRQLWLYVMFTATTRSVHRYAAAAP